MMVSVDNLKCLHPQVWFLLAKPTQSLQLEYHQLGPQRILHQRKVHCRRRNHFLRNRLQVLIACLSVTAKHIQINHVLVILYTTKY